MGHAGQSFQRLTSGCKNREKSWSGDDEVIHYAVFAEGRFQNGHLLDPCLWDFGAVVLHKVALDAERQSLKGAKLRLGIGFQKQCLNFPAHVLLGNDGSLCQTRFFRKLRKETLALLNFFKAFPIKT